MRRLFLIITLLTCSAPARAQSPASGPGAELYTPDSSVRYAAADILALPPHVQPYIRYLSLYNTPREKRSDLARLVSFAANSLSRRKKIHIPVFVGSSGETVIRINLKDYDIDPKQMDNLGRKGSGPRPFPEPYFHAFAERVSTETDDNVVRKSRQVATGRHYYSGQPEYRTEYYDVVEKRPRPRKRELLSAPWLDPTAVATLVGATQSEFPIFRADWFVTYSTVDPAYHLILGLGESEKTFDEAVYADDALAAKARSQVKGVVVKSSVARNNRTLTRSPTFTNGYKWQSHDTLKSTDDRNYVQRILDEKFDAKEIIAALPNGLQAYFITNGQGVRLDKADNDIATDYTADDKIVRNGRSCIYCHSPGINPIQDEIRSLNKRILNHEQVMLLITSEEDAYRIEDLFDSDLDRQIVRDQQAYADAIGQTTGMTPQQTHERYLQLWEGYFERIMTVDQIARDVGMTRFELEQFCRLSNDNLFLGLVKQPIRAVRRDHFEQAFQTFMILVMRARAGDKPGLHPAIILDADKYKDKKPK